MARKKRNKKASAAARPRDFSNEALSGLAGLIRDAPAGAEPPALSERGQAQRAPEGGEDEDSQFVQAMAGVVPLAERSPALPPPPVLPKPQAHADREDQEVIQALQDLVEGDAPFSIHLTDESIEGIADGVDRRLLRRLKRGEFSVQDHLDLHGLSRKEARPLVDRFIAKAIAEGKRCVLIIHGRGHGSKDKIPVLKLALKSWLVRSGIRKHILAFSTALPFDGGGGAIYVLLRRVRRIT